MKLNNNKIKKYLLGFVLLILAHSGHAAEEEEKKEAAAEKKGLGFTSLDVQNIQKMPEGVARILGTYVDKKTAPHQPVKPQSTRQPSSFAKKVDLIAATHDNQIVARHWNGTLKNLVSKTPLTAEQQKIKDYLKGAETNVAFNKLLRKLPTVIPVAARPFTAKGLEKQMLQMVLGQMQEKQEEEQKELGNLEQLRDIKRIEQKQLERLQQNQNNQK